MEAQALSRLWLVDSLESSYVIAHVMKSISLFRLVEKPSRLATIINYARILSLI